MNGIANPILKLPFIAHHSKYSENIANRAIPTKSTPISSVLRKALSSKGNKGYPSFLITTATRLKRQTNNKLH